MSVFSSDQVSPLAHQLDGYRLTTAEILYRLPDHPTILQMYLWQALDLAPKFPELRRFLDFWNRELDGPIHQVRYAVCDAVTPGRWTGVTDAGLLH